MQVHEIQQAQRSRRNSWSSKNNTIPGGQQNKLMTPFRLHWEHSRMLETIIQRTRQKCQILHTLDILFPWLASVLPSIWWDGWYHNTTSPRKRTRMQICEVANVVCDKPDNEKWQRILDAEGPYAKVLVIVVTPLICVTFTDSRLETDKMPIYV
jgi:hypothetical protein